MSPDPFWRASAQRLLADLETHPEGLTTPEAQRRRRRDGPNRLSERKRAPLLAELLKRLANPMVLILLVAAAIAGATGQAASFAIIVTVIAASTGLDLVQARHAQTTAEGLRKTIALRATTRRDGARAEVPAEDLVSGDVVELAAGDLVPADGLVLEAKGLQVDQAALTGEPYPAAKRAGPADSLDMAGAANAVFAGSSVVAGAGVVLIVATGARTQLGAIAGALAAPPPPTAFEHDLRRLGGLILRMTAFLVLLVLTARLALGRPPLETLLFALALAVGLTPELLPMITTVSLARGAERLAARKVVIKRLSAIHDLGQMDVLCTDKTGTLTEARIALVGHPRHDGLDSDRVAELAAVNAQFETGLKSPLDAALLAHASGLDLAPWRKLDERPFNFERRRVSVLAQHGDERLEILKGAPEAVLPLCDHYEDDGEARVLDAAARARLVATQDAKAAQGFRLLAVAWRSAAGQTRLDANEAAFVFCGWCVFLDPPKASATAAIARLEAAGVRLKVISGDAAPVVSHLTQALAIPVDGVLTGEVIATLSEAALAARVEAVDIFARVSPVQKTRIVRALQARGRTVGFLGDGVNDAAALRAADVGLSVDGAADVAREAADIILLTSDLGVAADGVTEGRRTYGNIMKYVRMGTSSNFGNMLTMALASVALPFLPLTAAQVLLNNLLYDLAQLGIPLDTVEAREAVAPHAWDMRQILRFCAIMGPLSSLFDIAVFVTLLSLFKVDVAAFRAAWFLESMASQILVIFVIRTRGRFWRVRPHWALSTSAIGALGVAFLCVATPLAGPLGFSPPGGGPLLAVGGLVAVYLIAAEGLKGLAFGAAFSAPARAASARTRSSPR